VRRNCGLPDDLTMNEGLMSWTETHKRDIRADLEVMI
jgi:hypothetical protein